jgi:ATP/maltotriose-dependent transcriptional regulator MalT
LNRIEEAKAVAKAGLARNPDFFDLHDVLFGIALLQGDAMAMEKERSELRKRPDMEMGLAWRDARLAASRGQARQAREMMGKVRQMALRLELKESVIAAQNQEAGMDALLGYSALAIGKAKTALANSLDYNNKLSAAATLAFAGENNLSQQKAQEVAGSRPDDTFVQAVFAPLVQAQVALNSGNAAKALQLLSSAEPYDKAGADVLYTRGSVYLKLGQGVDAAKQFQSVLSLRSIFPADPILSVSQLGLARAFALQGDKQKALTAYQDFFALWKDADPDVSILKQAKAEYAKLQ